MISPVKNGVRRACRPAMTRISSGGAPGSVSARRKSAMLTSRRRGPRSRGSQRSRSRLASICRARWGAGVFSSASVRRPAIASGSRPWRAWKRRSASASGGVEESSAGVGAGGQLAGGGEAPAQRRHPRAPVALAQRRPPGDERPAAGGGDRPLGGEGVAQQPVVVARRGQGVERGGEVAVLERGGEQQHQVAPPAGDVPLGFDGFRAHPPGRQVRGVEEEGVGEQQVEVERIVAGAELAAGAAPARRPDVAARAARRSPRGGSRRGAGPRGRRCAGRRAGRRSGGRARRRRSRRGAARAPRRSGADPPG